MTVGGWERVEAWLRGDSRRRVSMRHISFDENGERLSRVYVQIGVVGPGHDEHFHALPILAEAGSAATVDEAAAVALHRWIALTGGGHAMSRPDPFFLIIAAMLALMVALVAYTHVERREDCATICHARRSHMVDVTYYGCLCADGSIADEPPHQADVRQGRP